MPFDRSLKIAPSILAADFARLGEECRAIEAAGADWVHVDVMDGHFVANLTFGPGMCAALRPHIQGVMDVHLMITPVDPMLEAFAKAGADHLTCHLESGPHIHRSLQTIRALGCKAGLAINPGSPLDAVPDLLDMVDVLMVMTVNPGFGGQKLIPANVDKINRLKTMVGDRPIHIQIDGGVGTHNAATLVEAGADVLVAGASLFAGTDYAGNISALRSAAEGR